MHPIVKEFINTSNGINHIVEKLGNKEQFLERVFIDLVQVMNNEKVDSQLFIDLDQAIRKGHPDTSLYLLFISFAIPFTSNRGQLERAKAISSIGFSLSEDNTHPILKSYFIVSNANLALLESNHVECDRLLKEAVANIDKNQPRYITILISIALIISTQGRLKELGKEDFELIDSQKDEYRIFIFLRLKLDNCVFTGNFKEGFELINAFKNKFKGDREYTIQQFLDLFKILSGDLDKNNYDDEYFKLYVTACFELAMGNLKESLRISEFIGTKNWSRTHYFPFKKYFPLHLELCLKNKGKARLLLQEIIQNEGLNYIDDFFLARLQLLEMNREGAYESFARLIENVNRYGALNRLLFELQFAKEMNVADVFLLSNRLRNADGVKISTPPIAEAATVAQTGKGVELLIGDSLIMSQLKKLVKKYAKLKEPVLITGETGTGKELVSRAIHEAGSHSKDPFIAINCGALTESLLESELFGYEAGAFTGAQKERKGIFEAAGKGTVFLDEFGDISPKMQVSLLRVLESGEIRLIGGTKTRQVECKIIIATNLDLQKAVDEKKFREDLYFRLNRFDIKLPPLRERVEDIPKLIDHFLNNNKGFDGKTKILSKRLLDALVSYRWPGNIRELKNEIERLKILHSDKEILDIEDFDFTHLQSHSASFFQNTEKEEDKKRQDQTLSIKYNDITNDRILSIMNEVSTAYQRQRFLKKLFQQYKTINRVQIMKIAEISQSTASKDLDLLCKEGFIKKVTPSKSVRSHYFTIIE